MAILDRRGRGHYPYVMQTEPYYNGAPLSKANVLQIYPRFTSSTDADNFTFNSSDDYSPTSEIDGTTAAYADLSLEWIANTQWYTNLAGGGGTSNQLNHPGSGGMGASPSWAGAATPFYASDNGTRYGISVWMSIGVGTRPHPGTGSSDTYFALLRNSNGSHQGGSFWDAPSNVANFSSPRTWMSGTEKVRVTGQRYGTTNYRDWMCLAQYEPQNPGGINATTMRIINIGRNGALDNSLLTIYGFKVMLHILPSSGWDDYAI